MAFKVDLTARDLDKQLDLLRHFPSLTDKHYRPVVRRNVKSLSQVILPKVPVATGTARASFGSRVTGKGMGLTGRVGWFDKGDPWYPNVLEYGAAAHEMNTFVPRLGKYIKVHPGISAIGFMAAGYSALQARLTAEIAAANNAILDDMRVR